MRKLFWWSAGWMVAGAFAVTLAANHISNHPDSWLGRCFIPVAAVQARPANRALLAGTVQAAIKAFAPQQKPDVPRSDKLMAQAMPADCADALPGSQFVEATEPIQVGTPSTPPVANSSEGVVVSAPSIPAGYPVPPSSSATSAYTTGTPGDQEECEAGTPAMPPCPVCVLEDKLTMPPCPEDEDTKQVFLPYVEEDGAMKEEFAPSTCTWLQWLMKQAGVSKKSDDYEKTEQLVPVTPGVAPETPEESEPMVPMSPPKCQEDPNYHHEYPGCPYMGTCPYTGRSVPEMKPEATPKKTKHKKKKTGATPMSLSGKLKTLLDGGQDVKECHTSEIKLDTMECRPSDLRLPGLDPREPF